ncbi:MAG: hypothetical protein ACM33T_11035 [Solirubrobacterales bacterium]
MGISDGDDVICIRVDTARAVREFLDLLAAQAAEGETRAPAKPRATAVYRELAPYRLVEYNYVDDGIGEVIGAYVGLADGAVYSASDEIPEDLVDALVAGEVDAIEPVYVYVILADRAPPAAIEAFLAELSQHIGLPLVGVFHGEGRQITARGFDGVGPHPLDGRAALAAEEASRHLTKAQVLERFHRRAKAPDGRAFAHVQYGFAKHVLEFRSDAERDDFVEWSRKLCEVAYASAQTWEALGFQDVFRPAEPMVTPEPRIVVTRIDPPSKQDAWKAFAEGEPSMEIARRYWATVKEAIDWNESGAGRLDGWVVRG